jgi:hypothetical protein
VYIGALSIIAVVGYDTYHNKYQEFIGNDIKSELILNDNIKYLKNELNPISRDLIIGDYTPSTITYYPTLSFSATAGFGSNFSTNEYVLVGQLDESLNYGIYFYKADGICNLVLRDTDTQNTYYLGRYNYNASKGAWDLILGSDGYLGILQLIDASINFVPRSWVTNQTTTYTILDIGLITTTQQNYNYYFDTYTILGSTFGAYSEGVAQGENNVKNNPNSYGLYTQQQFNSYGANRYQEGYNAFEEELMENPEEKGFVSKDYFDEAVDASFDDGKSVVLDNPNNYGLYTQEQYNNALGSGSSGVLNPVFNWLNQASGILSNVFSVEVFPNITLGLLICFPLVIALLFFILKLFFGG